MSSKKKPIVNSEASLSRTGKTGKQAKSQSPQSSSEQAFFSPGAIREIVESIVIAFVLAFLFRTFEAEAFVIPTGSMAPTLMGRHKDLICDECGYPFQVSASDEIDQHTNRPNGVEVISATCPICRHTMYVGSNSSAGKSNPSYKGDRILVTKFAYQFSDPKRWDVVVFKYPVGAQTNFIKRAVGLPGETIQITHGDVFVQREGEETPVIARKPPPKILAMLQPVDDTQYVLPQIADGTWPSRWTASAVATDEPSGEWTTRDQRSFRIDGSAEGDVWLGYRHLVPSYEDWREYLTGSKRPVQMRPQLISDFTAYDTDATAGGSRDSYFSEDRSQWLDQKYTTTTDKGVIATGPPPFAEKMGLHWVGDLAVEADVKVESASGDLILALVKGGHHFQVRIDVATGKATLSITGLEGFQPTATTKVRGPGTYHLRFANVDQQLVLWVNGSVVTFDGPGIAPGGADGAVAYELPQPAWRPQVDDLEPVRVGSRKLSMEVQRLTVSRDIYYIAQRYVPGGPVGTLMDFDRNNSPYRYQTREEVADVMSSPDRWGAFAKTRAVKFTLDSDQFFMLGDNSAESKDGRLWENGEHYVKRELLIGKALLVYWPHSLDQIPGTSIPIRFFPNFWRMGLIR